jgi:uncharacterized membrane protein YccC
MALSVSVVSACARPTVSVIPMRDIPREQQERDSAECARYAGRLDVTKPVTGAVSAQWLGAAAGAVVGLMVVPLASLSTSDPKEAGLILAGGAAVGAAVGFGVGTVVGWQSGLDRAHGEYLRAYAACMRERGYSVSRDRR